MLTSRQRVLAVVTSSFFVACGAQGIQEGDEEGAEFGRTKQALTSEQARVLSFETPTTDWSSGSGVLGTSSNVRDGSSALAVTPGGWTEINSIPLSTLENVRDTLSYDIYLPQTPGWGETRAILVAPSLGMWWTELGRQELQQLPGGQYSTVSFALQPSLVTALSGSYSDLRIKLVINAPVLSQPYLVDHLVMTNDAQPDPTPEPVTEETFSVLVPAGINVRDTFMSATDHLSIFSQARAGVSGTTSAIANFGTFTTYLQAEARAYANIYSVGPVQLDSKTLVGGSVTTEGTIGQQGVGTGDAPVVEGGQFPSTAVDPDVIDWSVLWPTPAGPDIQLNAAPTQSPVSTTLPPGTYGDFNVHSRNHVFLSSGTYFFDTFNTEPEAELHLDTSSGAIVIYVRQNLAWGGGVGSKAPVFTDAGNEAQLLLAFLGTGDVFIQGSWQGTIVAPDALIKLERPSNPGLSGSAPSHKGAFFARSIEVAAGAHSVQHVPFNSSIPPGETSTSEAPAAGEHVVFQIPFPQGASPNDVVVLGSVGVNVGAGTSVVGADGQAALTSAGVGGLTLGSGASVSSVLSLGGINAGDGASFSGPASARGDVTLGNGVQGTVQGGQTVPNFEVLDCPVVFATPEDGDILLQDGRSKIALPGSYGSVQVSSGAKLYLKDGEYTFSSLAIDAGGELILESAGGVTRAFVQGTFSSKGNVSGQGLTAPKLFVAAWGTSAIEIEGNFTGVVVAPRATVNVAGGATVTGAVIGKNVELLDASVSHGGIDVADILFACSVPSIPDEVVSIAEAEVVLHATVDISSCSSVPGEVSVDSPVAFQIPKKLQVTEGNAGNHQALLEFTQANGVNVTCTYAGGSTLPHPTTRLDMALGREYLFQQCDNGALALSSVNVDALRLTIEADCSWSTNTSVEVALGTGCLPTVGSFISPGEAVQMFESFSWFDTEEVEEENEDGSQALYYATVYLRSQEDAEMMDRLLIHNQSFPLFLTEYPEEFFGRCGGVAPSGDAEGEWRFAVIPGAVYNAIRRLVVDDELEVEGSRVLFEAITLRDAPPGALTSNGALSYDFLQEAGFRWNLGGTELSDLPDNIALEDSALHGGQVANAVVNAVGFVFDVAVGATRLALRVLAEIDRFLAGSVRVSIDVDVLNRDNRFTGLLRQAWGPNSGDELSIDGAKVSLFQVVGRLYTLGRPLPTVYTGRTNRAGEVSLKVAKSGSLGSLGITYSGGVCIHAENKAANITQSIGYVPWMYCIFPAGSSLTSSDPGLGYSEDTSSTLETDTGGLHNLAEFTEARDYARGVIGGKFEQAHVLKGYWATLLSLQNGAWAPCLRVGGTKGLSLGVGLTNLGFVVEAYYALLGASDIVLGGGGNHEEQRGIATHEYGHFVFCSLLVRSGATGDAFAKLRLQTVVDGIDGEGEIDSTDETRMLNEAFADFFAGQAVGGANYFGPPDANNELPMGFCDGSGADCLDENYLRTSADTGRIIGAVATTLHDAFDGHYGNSAGANEFFGPTNADFWRETGGVLRHAATAYGNANDEEITLAGPVLDDIVQGFFDRTDFGAGGIFEALEFEDFQTSLIEEVRERYDWCQSCRLVSRHEQLAQVTPPSGIGLVTDGVSEWEACLASPYAEGLGEPPDPTLTMSSQCGVCPLNTVRVVVGDTPPTCPDPASRGGVFECAACPQGWVADRGGQCCSQCPPGERSVGTECVPCASNEVVVSNSCQQCELGTGPNAARTGCELCPSDATADLTAVNCSPVGDPLEFATLVSLNPMPDICPDTLVVDVTTDPARITALDPDILAEPEGAACLDEQVSLRLTSSGSNVGVFGISSTGTTCTPASQGGAFLDCPLGTCEFPGVLSRPAGSLQTVVRVVVGALNQTPTLYAWPACIQEQVDRPAR